MPITDESKGPKTKGVSMSYLIGFAFVVVIIIILGFCGHLVEKYKNWLFKQYCVLEQKEYCVKTRCSRMEKTKIDYEKQRELEWERLLNEEGVERYW